MLSFENSLFGDSPSFEYEESIDEDFLVDKLVMFPALRPLFLDRIVSLCKCYCQSRNIRKKLLNMSIDGCPVMIYKLFLEEMFTFGEISELLDKNLSGIIYYYFKNQIEEFEDRIMHKEAYALVKKLPRCGEDDIQQMIRYGFVPETVEYCLKYDDIDQLLVLLGDFENLLDQNAIWSPFEWAKKPDTLSFLSFAGYFGSIKCFKLLILKGFNIDQSICESVVCSGSMDLFHICYSYCNNYSDLLSKAIVFHHFSIICFLIENGVNVNEKNGGFVL